MARRLLLVAAFSVTLGHLAWHALVVPPAPEYHVGGDFPGLCGPDPGQKNLYLRRVVHLSERPRHAWLQVVARDRLSVYVNGRLFVRETADGFPVGAVIDPTPYLQVGPNVIAVVARQASIGHPPLAAPVLGYTLNDGQEHLLPPDGSWRCSSILERQGSWWFEPAFDDRHWPAARAVPCDLRAPVSMPPRATTAGGVGRWITPATPDTSRACMRRDFHVAGRPGRAWLRVTTRAAYRLAVNGILIDVHEQPLGTARHAPPVRRTYDVTPVVREGHNVLALTLASPSGPPALLADLEVETSSGQRYAVGTDDRWRSRPDHPPDWMDPAPADPEIWEACVEAAGDLGIPPWMPRREAVALTLPLPVLARRAAGQAGLMILIALLTWPACWCASRLLSRPGVAYLALVPPTLGIAAALLATYDPRIARQDVYQGPWLVLAVLSVLAQWVFLALLAPGKETRSQEDEERNRVASSPRLLAALSICGLLAVGFWLRVKDLDVEPLQWDEVENYQYTQGFLKHGFPVREVHPDLPLAVVHTSELTFVPNALAALASDDGRLVVRLPAACWSTLTILLIYLAGRRFFGESAGLIAAALYTFSPVVIAMSNFGRYFSQLQFFTLLTVYLFWLTVRGTGPLNVRALWGTVFSFIAMYLTWEGAALLALGMMLAALVERRGRLRTVFGNPHVWLGMLVVLMAVLIQYSHAVLQKTQFLWYGTSLSDLRLRPLWQYPTYRPWYYVWQSAWTQDAFLPMLGLLAAGVLAVRHAYRRPARFLLVIHVGTCLIMASLLPAIAWRYIHHQIPLLLLLAAAALAAGARGLVRLGGRAPRPPSLYARGVGVLLVVVLLLLGSGLTAQLTEMPGWRVEGYNPAVYKFPNLRGPARHVRERLREGDVVLATDPFQVRHLMGFDGRADAPAFYWPESLLLLSATLDDSRPVLLDRRDGTPMLSDRESFEDLFARHRRIWYVVQPHRHDNQNSAEVSAFLRQHMEVVHEDFEALVLFRDASHRPAYQRRENERALEKARAHFLPEARHLMEE